MDIPGINPFSNIQLEWESKRQQSKADSFQTQLEEALKNEDEEAQNAEIKEACQEFESYFLHMMFKEMRKTVQSEDGLIPKSNGEQIFQDMLDEETAKNATKVGGIGLADEMYRQMTRSNVVRSKS